MKFRSRRLTLKKQQASQASIPYPQGSLHFREELRRRFVLQCKKYLGVPYAQRYHAEENCACDGCKAAGRNMYHDELFLDCCALVRRAVADLSTNFGFKLGPGNQAYQLDTLPVRKSSVSELEPGDLVFYYGKYYSPTAKPQPGDVVHVEVYLGDELGTGPESVIGSRFGKERVTLYDSYQFVSKKWELLGYEFASIDTWLDGTLQNFNEERTWAAGRPVSASDRARAGGKYSLFAADAQNADDCDADVAADDGADD